MKRKIATALTERTAITRCKWCTSSNLYQKYHDDEWGVPKYDDNILFEMLVLESFQAGLSWITILNKRENFRKAFDEFDWEVIRGYSEAKVGKLLQDDGIIRHRGKILATIANANAFVGVRKEFGTFSKYFWSFSEGKPLPKIVSAEQASRTILSDSISKDLKKRGFKFVGSTTVYAYMQAVGMVDDHSSECWKFSTEPSKARSKRRIIA